MMGRERERKLQGGGATRWQQSYEDFSGAKRAYNAMLPCCARAAEAFSCLSARTRAHRGGAAPGAAASAQCNWKKQVGPARRVRCGRCQDAGRRCQVWVRRTGAAQSAVVPADAHCRDATGWQPGDLGTREGKEELVRHGARVWAGVQQRDDGGRASGPRQTAAQIG